MKTSAIVLHYGSYLGSIFHLNEIRMDIINNPLGFVKANIYFDFESMIKFSLISV